MSCILSVFLTLFSIVLPSSNQAKILFNACYLFTAPSFESEKVIDILNEPLYAEEIKKEVSINPIIPKIIAGNFLITLDKVRGINND